MGDRASFIYDGLLSRVAEASGRGLMNSLLRFNEFKSQSRTSLDVRGFLSFRSEAV